VGNLFQVPPVGPSTHNLDADDRLIIPQRMRGLLGSSFVLTRGVEKCLWILPETLFTTMIQGWTKDLSCLDANSRKLAWRFVGQAVQVSVDKQSRVVLPLELRESAGISSDRPIIALGMINRVELWDLETWRQHEAALDGDSVQKALDAHMSPSALVGGEGAAEAGSAEVAP